MKLKYPKSETSIDDMCEIIKFFCVEAKEYTDCAIVYEITFETLRAIYNLGKDNAKQKTCSDERPCINCYADQGECIGPYKDEFVPELFPGTLEDLNKLGIRA